MRHRGIPYWQREAVSQQQAGIKAVDQHLLDAPGLEVALERGSHLPAWVLHQRAGESQHGQVHRLGSPCMQWMHDNIYIHDYSAVGNQACFGCTCHLHDGCNPTRATEGQMFEAPVLCTNDRCKEECLPDRLLP